MTAAALARHAEPVMGTVVSFAWRAGATGEDAARDAVRQACRRLHDIDHRFSTWRADSPMSRIRRGELAPDADPEVAAVLDRCRELREVSAGWFDPWSAPGGVDPTGMVKGWAAEQACALLRRAGVAAALVNAGGDVATHGGPGPSGGSPWRVGVRHPWRPDALAGVVALGDGAALASSGTYERGLHLWRPDGRLPGAVAASVAGPSLATADALATALAVGGVDFFRALGGIDGYEGWLVTADGTEHATDGFPWTELDPATIP